MHFHERAHVGAEQPLNVKGQVSKPHGDDPVQISFRDYEIHKQHLRGKKHQNSNLEKMALRKPLTVRN